MFFFANIYKIVHLSKISRIYKNCRFSNYFEILVITLPVQKQLRKRQKESNWASFSKILKKT